MERKSFKCGLTTTARKIPMAEYLRSSCICCTASIYRAQLLVVSGSLRSSLVTVFAVDYVDLKVLVWHEKATVRVGVWFDVEHRGALKSEPLQVFEASVSLKENISQVQY